MADTHHISLFYDDEDERMEYLAQHFTAGLKEHELCVFVTEMTVPQATRSLKRAGLEISPAVRDGQMRLFNATATYLQSGSFVADFMLSNVQAFLEEAAEQGFSGLRTAGEMNWLASHPEYHDAGRDYEQAVNNLEHEINFVGLCLYATHTLPDNVLQNAISTHPEISYQGISYRKPFYVS